MIITYYDIIGPKINFKPSLSADYINYERFNCLWDVTREYFGQIIQIVNIKKLKGHIIDSQKTNFDVKYS